MKEKVPYIREGGRWTNAALMMLRARGYELGLEEELPGREEIDFEDERNRWFARKGEELWISDVPWAILGLVEVNQALGRVAWLPGDPDPVTPVLERALGNLSENPFGCAWLRGLNAGAAEPPTAPVSYMVYITDPAKSERQAVFQIPAYRVLEARGYEISPYVLTSETDEPAEPDENGEIKGWVSFWLAKGDDVELGGLEPLSLLGVAVCWEEWRRLPEPSEPEDIRDEIQTRVWGD